MTDIADLRREAKALIMSKTIHADLRRRMKAVMRSHPALTTDGFSYRRDSLKPEDLLSDDCLNQFRLCREWLGLCEFRKSMNLQGTSYGYKHMVERWAGIYIFNGVFIAAALSLGIEIRRDEGSRNCFLPISSASIKKLDSARRGEEIPEVTKIKKSLSRKKIIK